MGYTKWLSAVLNILPDHLMKDIFSLSRTMFCSVYNSLVCLISPELERAKHSAAERVERRAQYASGNWYKVSPPLESS